MPEIREQIEAVRRVHKENLAVGYSGVFLPRQLDKNYRSAAREFIWQWFFPPATLTSMPGSGEKRRYHLHDPQVQNAFKKAASEEAYPSAFHLIHSDTHLQAISCWPTTIEH